MNEIDLTDLLERTGVHVVVGTPPTEALLRRRTTSVRRRRHATALGAALVSAGVAVALLVPLTSGDKERPPAPRPEEPRNQSYGIGRLIVDVPDDWVRNAQPCTRPVAGTVHVGGRVIHEGWCRPTSITDTISISRREANWTPIDGTFLGEEVRLRPTSCRTYEVGGSGSGPFDNADVPKRKLTSCDAAVYFPADEVLFRFQAGTKGRVEEMLGWIRLSHDQIGVPGYEPIDLQRNDDGLKYAAQLRALGFDVTVKEKADRWASAGDYLGSDENIGTVLPRGAPITITVGAPVPGVRGKVRVEFWTTAPNGRETYASDSDLRRRIHRVAVDDDSLVRVIADGEFADRVTARVTGARLEPSHSRDTELAWRARGPGRAAIHLSMTVDGEQIGLGTILIGIRG